MSLVCFSCMAAWPLPLGVCDLGEASVRFANAQAAEAAKEACDAGQA